MRPGATILAFLLPFMAAAQSDEWMRDNMSDDSLWLLKTSNLKSETTNSSLLPGSTGGPSQWVMSQGDGPAYVVYFIPGKIEEVEIDTHRLTGASGDFSLAVSTDGKLFQPIDSGSVTLDSAFGWDYRLMSAEDIPSNATHLLVQFPEGASAHRLSEVWIRYQWDDAVASRFLPAPAVQATPASSAGNYSYQSDAELQAMLAQLQNVAPAQQPVAVRANIPGYESDAGAKPQPEKSNDEGGPPLLVSVNLSDSRTQSSVANPPMNLKFGDVSSVEATSGSSPTAEEEHDEKTKKTAAADSSKIDLNADGLLKNPDELPAGKSDPKKESAEEEPEVAWVLPTLTLPVFPSGGPDKHVERPNESPTGDPQTKIGPVTSDETHSPASAAPDAASQTGTIPISSLALDNRVEEAGAKPSAVEGSAQLNETPTAGEHSEATSSAPMSVAIGGEEPRPVVEQPSGTADSSVTEPMASISKTPAVEETSEPDPSRPATSFVRRGPRSKSHTFFSSRR